MVNAAGWPILTLAVERVRRRHRLGDAVWVLDVEKFGPFLVESDLAGNSLFERENAKIAPGLEQLYAGTRPATLRRYGETDDKTEEVI